MRLNQQALSEAYTSELARVYETLEKFKNSEAVNCIGIMLLEEALEDAQEAQESGDVIKMLIAYDNLQTIP